jgi:hypothetical protein
MKLKTKKRWIYWLLIVGAMIANASAPDGDWVNTVRVGEIREIQVHGTRVELISRYDAIERLEGERIGNALVFVRPRWGRAGAMMIFRPIGHRVSELSVRNIRPDGRLGRKRVFRFRRKGAYGIRPYLGEWRLQESIPDIPVHVRITKRRGKPYIEAWRYGRYGEELLVRKYGKWKNGRIVLKWKGRRGFRQKAVIEGVGRDRRGFYRRIRVYLYREGTGDPKIYHLRRERRRGILRRY